MPSVFLAFPAYCPPRRPATQGASQCLVASVADFFLLPNARDRSNWQHESYSWPANQCTMDITKADSQSAIAAPHCPAEQREGVNGFRETIAKKRPTDVACCSAERD